VPAATFGVSTNFALANFLASRSFGNTVELISHGTLARAIPAAHRRALAASLFMVGPSGYSSRFSFRFPNYAYLCDRD
jgi:hypothetical protein